MEGLLDISRQDLQELLQEAQLHALRGRVGTVRCQEVMSRDLVVTAPQALAMEAWHLLSTAEDQGAAGGGRGRQAGRHHHTA